MWLLLSLVLVSPAAEPPDAPPHVRPGSASAQTLLADAASSPAVAALLARLDRSDQIVYVTFTSSPEIPRARTKLVAATPEGRFLRIDLSLHLPPWERLPLLAHELQHAVELADAPDVRDDEGVRQLYRRIGLPGTPDKYETAAARAIERQVRAEILRAKR
jgi:hypothetical protein